MRIAARRGRTSVRRLVVEDDGPGVSDASRTSSKFARADGDAVAPGMGSAHGRPGPDQAMDGSSAPTGACWAGRTHVRLLGRIAAGRWRGRGSGRRGRHAHETGTTGRQVRPASPEKQAARLGAPGEGGATGELARPALLVEDDESRRFVARYLTRRGYRVDEAATAADAWRGTSGRPPAHRPGLPDMASASSAGAPGGPTPIIVLSARDERGASLARCQCRDYLTKPFGTDDSTPDPVSPPSSVGAPAGTDGLLRLGPVELDPLGHAVAVGGTPVHLTPREFELLRVLMTHPGRVVTKGRLLRAVWGVAYAEEGHYVHVYVNRLRRKLAAADPTGAAAGLIATEPGIATGSPPPSCPAPAGDRTQVGHGDSTSVDTSGAPSDSSGRAVVYRRAVSRSVSIANGLGR